MEPLVSGKLAGFSSEHKVSALVGVPQQARWEPMRVIPGIRTLNLHILSPLVSKSPTGLSVGAFIFLIFGRNSIVYT